MVVTFDAQYMGQDVKVAEYSCDFKNVPTTFEFTKVDITSGAELSGATLIVLDMDGNVIYTVYFRFLKILIIVPLGALAFSTMGGNRAVSHTVAVIIAAVVGVAVYKAKH